MKTKKLPRAFGQDGIIETGFSLPPQTTPHSPSQEKPKQTKYEDISGNEGSDLEIWPTNEVSPTAAPAYSLERLQVTAQGRRTQEDPCRLPELETQS